MDRKLPNSAFLILMVYQQLSLELSPSIRAHNFYTVAGLCLDIGFIKLVRLDRLALLALKIELRLPGCIINPGRHVEVSIKTFHGCRTPQVPVDTFTIFSCPGFAFLWEWLSR